MGWVYFKSRVNLFRIWRKIRNWSHLRTLSGYCHSAEQNECEIKQAYKVVEEKDKPSAGVQEPGVSVEFD
jgi:hypothetical protein